MIQYKEEQPLQNQNQHEKVQQGLMETPQTNQQPPYQTYSTPLGRVNQSVIGKRNCEVVQQNPRARSQIKNVKISPRLESHLQTIREQQSRDQVSTVKKNKLTDRGPVHFSKMSKTSKPSRSSIKSEEGIIPLWQEEDFNCFQPVSFPLSISQEQIFFSPVDYLIQQKQRSLCCKDPRSQ